MSERVSACAFYPCVPGTMLILDLMDNMSLKPSSGNVLIELPFHTTSSGDFSAEPCGSQKCGVFLLACSCSLIHPLCEYASRMLWTVLGVGEDVKRLVPVLR